MTEIREDIYGLENGKKSQQYRSLLKLSILLIFLLAISSTGVAIYVYSHGFVDSRICTTKACVNNAAYLINNMNTDVNPCHDFHEFACGRWSKLNPMPSDHSGYGAFSKLSKQVYSQVKALLSEPIGNEPDYVIKSKKMYQSCMDIDTIDSLGNKPLLDMLQKLGGWPVLAGYNWNPTDFQITSTFRDLSKLGLPVFLNMVVEADDKDSDKHIIIFKQASLDMRSKSSFTRNVTSPKFKYSKGYRKYAYDVALALGAEVEMADKDINAMVEFSIDLAKITLSRSENRMSDNLYNKLSLEELTDKFPDVFEWKEYLSEMFKETGYDISSETKILLYSKDYLTRLGPLLQKTPKRTLANYMLWQLVRNTIEYLPNAKFGDIIQQFKKVIRGSSHQSPRFQTCISASRQGPLGYAVGRMFVDKYFDKNAKLMANKMVDELKLSIINMMKHSDWMDKSTKSNAIAKAKVMKKNIGYSNQILNDDFLSESVQVDPQVNSYYDNVIDILRSGASDALGEILKPVDKSKWTLNPTVVNARSNEKNNLITFPAGILQPPFYSKDHSMAMNFGGIGTVIGHEITHEFDDEGSKYDKDGNMRKWWTKEVKQRYDEKTKCILKQYNNYYVPQIKMHCNGKRTLDENIADIGGVIESYYAYLSYIKKHGKEDKLPGLNMNNKQLFFLSFAQLWCGEMNDVRYRAKINNAHHSPYKFRVLGPLQNMKEFSETFNCPLGSPMNPKHKCTLW